MTDRLTAHLTKEGQHLAKMPTIQVLSPLVTRILAGNPGAYTLQGTNTYLIGSGPRRLLLDAGDGVEEYATTLKDAMRQVRCSALEGIVISHWHHDHLNGVGQVQSAVGPGIPVYKFMPDQDEEPYGGEGNKAVSEMWPRDQFTPLRHGSVLNTQGATLVAHYAPGHANDLCVFMLVEENNMFSSDNVLGQGTGVARDLNLYLQSLDLMAALKPRFLYPGHGPVVEDGLVLIDEYKTHRLKRVEQVRAAIVKHAPQSLGLEELCDAVYPELPDLLRGPAMFNLLLALQVLEAKGACVRDAKGWRASKL